MLFRSFYFLRRWIVTIWGALIFLPVGGDLRYGLPAIAVCIAIDLFVTPRVYEFRTSDEQLLADLASEDQERRRHDRRVALRSLLHFMLAILALMAVSTVLSVTPVGVAVNPMIAILGSIASMAFFANHFVVRFIGLRTLAHRDDIDTLSIFDLPLAVLRGGPLALYRTLHRAAATVFCATVMGIMGLFYLNMGYASGPRAQVLFVIFALFVSLMLGFAPAIIAQQLLGWRLARIMGRSGGPLPNLPRP